MLGLIWTHLFVPPLGITQSFLHAFWRTKWAFIWNILWVAQCHAEVHAALKDKVSAGAVWEQTIAWQLFWEQASANKGSTKTWHSFLAGLCKPLTKPLVSPQTECRYYTLRALFLGNFDHSAASSKTILSTPTCKTLQPLWHLVTCPSRYVAWMDLNELRGAKETETLRTQGLPSDFYLQISRKHISFLKKNKENRITVTTVHCKETNVPATYNINRQNPNLSYTSCSKDSTKMYFKAPIATLTSKGPQPFSQWATKRFQY